MHATPDVNDHLLAEARSLTNPLSLRRLKRAVALGRGVSSLPGLSLRNLLTAE